MDTEPISTNEYTQRRSEICGVSPIDINGTFGNKELEKLREELKKTGDYNLPFYDPRMDRADIPPQYFFVTPNMVEKLNELIQNSPEIDVKTILHYFLSNTDDVVDPQFSTNALNAINALYYSSATDFERIGVPFPFDRETNISKAIVLFLQKNIRRNRIRLQEICSGNRTSRLYSMRKSLNHGRALEVTLTDFTKKSLPEPKDLDELSTADFNLKAEELNLFNPSASLSEDDRYDAVLATYAFDSVWLPQDIRYEKYGNQWYRVKYRIKVGDIDPDRNEFTKTDIIESLRKGSTDSDTRGYYRRVAIERAVEEIDIQKVPYGKTIERRYGKQEQVAINVPGGLIQHVIESFNTRLKSDGVFLIGDVAVNNNCGFIKDQAPAADFSTAGDAAKYKSEDYGLAKQILEENGFQVELITVPDFVYRYAQKGQLHNDLPNHWIMIIKKKTFNLASLLQRKK